MEQEQDRNDSNKIIFFMAWQYLSKLKFFTMRLKIIRPAAREQCVKTILLANPTFLCYPVPAWNNSHKR